MPAYWIAHEITEKRSKHTMKIEKSFCSAVFVILLNLLILNRNAPLDSVRESREKKTLFCFGCKHADTEMNEDKNGTKRWK